MQLTLNYTTDTATPMRNDSGCTYHLDPEPVTDQHWAVIIILCIFSAVGVVGNGLVIYVYYNKKEKQTSNIFILALALTDLITCLIIMPMTVAYIYLTHAFKFSIICKIYHFLITSNVPLSAFIMVAIAFDRYLCICHPFLHLMTVFRAKVIVSVLTTFACILGLITAMLYSVEVFPDELQMLLTMLDPPRNLSKTIFQCDTVYIGECSVTRYIFTPTFRNVYQKVYASFFAVSLLFVLALYVIIYHSVTARRAKRQKQKAKTCNTKQYSTTMVQTEDTDIHHSTSNVVTLKVEMSENGVSSSTASPRLNNGEAVPLRHRQNTIKEKKDHNRLANIKTAVMLFVVTIVFIVAFLPAWLMAHEMIPYVITVFYMYFSYNVANPLIYAFMNPMFRDDMKRIFQKCVGRH